MRTRFLLTVLAVFALALVLTGQASASSYVAGTYADGYTDDWNVEYDYEYSAWVEFSLSGTTLTVDLYNTATETVTEEDQILTSLLFDISDDITLTGVSAELLGSSTIINDTPGTSDVSGEWAYDNFGDADSDGDNTWAVGSSEFGSTTLPNNLPNIAFDQTTLFDTSPSANLWDPATPNGIEYGIVPLGEDLSSATDSNLADPMIAGGVTFTFTVSSGFSLDDISNVAFQYGADASDPRLPPVPEPASIVLMGMGVAALIARKKAL